MAPLEQHARAQREEEGAEAGDGEVGGLILGDAWEKSAQVDSE